MNAQLGRMVCAYGVGEFIPTGRAQRTGRKTATEPLPGEQSHEGMVVLVAGKYRLKCDDGQTLLLDPQSEGARLLGKRIRIFGTLSKG